MGPGFKHKAVVQVTPTVSTSPAYTAEDAVGGVMTFSVPGGQFGYQGAVISGFVLDKACQAGGYELFLFSSNPSGSTVTDNAALVIADADISKLIGVIEFPISAPNNRFSFASTSAVYVTQGIYIPYAATVTSADSGAIYGALRAKGTPTFGATSDITVQLSLEYE